MTAPANHYLTTLLSLALVCSACYAGGRLHQWYRQGFERDDAYRTGYDQASHTLFAIATRAFRHRPAAIEQVPRLNPADNDSSLDVGNTLTRIHVGSANVTRLPTDRKRRPRHGRPEDSDHTTKVTKPAV
jgi:hypothetical protein